MTKYENNKRVCARGVTFIDDKVLLIERYHLSNHQMQHYYTIPGGGVEDEETYEDASVRETQEETSVKTEAVKFLYREEYDEGIVYWYLLKYIDGTPKLGGEELLRNNSQNHYKVVMMPFDKVDEINILGEGKKVLKEAHQYYLEEKNEKL